MKRWSRPPLDRTTLLRALADRPNAATTRDIVDQVPIGHSRSQVYYALAKLLTEGNVDKEIVFGATSIGHAFWSITDKGRELLDQEGGEGRG